VALAAAALIAVGPAQAITGGADAPAGAYPYAAKLSMPAVPRPGGNVEASACSGALVAPRWVITAGHCAHNTAGARTSGKPRYTIDVSVGGGAPLRAIRVVQNPGVDAALLELSAPVTAVEPLAVSTAAPTVGESLVLAGWGSTDGIADPTHRPARLQTADYEVTRVSADHVFARPTGPGATSSACPFDSGAPFVATGAGGARLVATEIGGPTCPQSGEETTARSDALAGWIETQTGTRG
jgi:secreted trypsin-like serine protease